MNTEISRIYPQAIDLEEAVLGALLIDKNAVNEVIDKLKPEVFYNGKNSIVFSAIQNLFSKCQMVDILTITAELHSMGKLEEVGGPYYLTQLTNRIASSAHIEDHIEILKRKYLRRELIDISFKATKSAYDETIESEEELLCNTENAIINLSKFGEKRDFESLSNIIRTATKEIEELAQNESGLIGVGSGFKEIDRKTGGWQRQNLIIIAGRPGMGKTAFVLRLARNAAVIHKVPVGFFSLEMSNSELAKRLISGETSIPHEIIKHGKLDNGDWLRFNNYLPSLLDAQVFIDDSAAISVFELRAKARRMKAKFNIGLIIVDYIQLMTTGVSGAKTNREQEISFISRSLKALAKELDIPVIALSQLSREVEKRGGGKRPQLSDLRESGAIEQDADMVNFVYRPSYYGISEWDDGTSTDGQAEIIIAKNRHGDIGDCRLSFIPHFIRFEDIEEMELGSGHGSLEPNYSFNTEPF